ncbi:hypothetical protein ACHAW6_015942 [Cyclotella cf. meneghiniana]
MARSKIHRKTNTSHQASVEIHDKCHCCVSKKSLNQSHHLTPAFLGHRCPQDAYNAIKFHSRTLSDEVCRFLLSNPPNLRLFIEFWSRPEQISLTSGACADTICGCSWMIALNYLFLGQVDAARAFMLNGGFIHQCAQKPIEDILILCQRGSAPLCDLVVKKELPYYQNAFASSHLREHMERYLMSVLPPDFVRRMSFAAHSGHQTGMSTWVSNYVSVIGNDWRSSSHRTKRVIKGVDDSSIQITMLHNETALSTSIRVSHTLKELFIKFSEEKGVSLRSLRFSFKGKPLFLSSASNKTPAQLGMKNHDVIHVFSTTSISSSQDDLEYPTVICTHKEPSKNVNKHCRSEGKRVKSITSSITVTTDIAQSHKLQHSQALSKLFEEVEPKFRAIRQRLNTSALERTLPKEKSAKMASSPPAQEAAYNADIAVVGGKAGRSFYVIQVGEVHNLYKSSKKLTGTIPEFHMIDLHGYTRLDALDKLNECLPRWEKYAMEGSYPFVAPVLIVCGGGNQIISETVSKWIKHNKVSNAPRKLFARAA